MPVIVLARCTACGACLATCPEGALLPAPRRPVVNIALCIDCLECIEVCPAGAVELDRDAAVVVSGVSPVGRENAS